MSKFSSLQEQDSPACW